MADTREQILSRLVTVCQGVTGISAVARNETDVPGIARPAVIVHDGAEQFVLKPERVRFAEVQIMEMSPELELRVRADSGSEGGSLLSMFRNRLVVAIPADAALQTLVGTNGEIRYEGNSKPRPDPEAKDARMILEFVFRYPLRASDLAA